MNASPRTTVMVTLIRREFWEHRVLWMAPALLALLLVVCAVAARLHFVHIQTTADVFSDPNGRAALFVLAQYLVTVPLYLVTAIILNFYLLDCLYTERKDRSILFWKSLPVSDAATVTSKFLVALLVVPLGVYLLGLATSLLFSTLWIQEAAAGAVASGLTVWNAAAWLKVQAWTLLMLLVSVLWYAPLAAYLVLISAWARRSVFLWATLLPVFAVLIEKFALGTHFVSDLLNYRLWGIWRSMQWQSAAHAVASADHGAAQYNYGRLMSLASPFDAADVRPLFANIDLWLGIIVALALAYAAVRIRRYRDDT